MIADRRKIAEALFQAAADLPVTERADYLCKQCGTDAPLRAEVDDLLRTLESDLGDFLSPPVAPVAPGDHSQPPARSIPDDTTIGHYHVEREIGRGGMGTVYLALDKKLRRNVAIKMLPDEFTHDPQRRALFEREARTAANLNHPNIATIYELGELNGSYFISMEYVKGVLLDAVYDHHEPLPLLMLLDIAVQIAEGLTAAHAANIVHRDLKPGNIMMTDEARIKILDFGLAKALQGDVTSVGETFTSSASQKASACFGTVGYSSPEQCSGEPVDFRSDLFSFGVVLYELATGRAPFARSNLAETMTAVLNEDPVPPADLNAELPAELADLIDKLLAKEPGDRHHSSRDVLAVLKRLNRRTAAPRQPLHERPRRRQSRQLKRRLKYTSIALGAAVLLVAFALARMWMVDPQPRIDPQVALLWQLLGEGNVEEARTLYTKLQTDWGSDDARLPDDRLLELHFLISRGDIAQARALLATLRTEWGPNHDMLRAPAAGLTATINELWADQRVALIDALALGDLDRAAEITEEIRALDGDGPFPAEAQALVDAAQQRTRRVDHLATSVEADLVAGALGSALEALDELDALDFEGRVFHAAQSRARDLRRVLNENLIVRAEALLASPDELALSDIDDAVALLRAVLPQSEQLERLRMERTRLERQQTLRGLRDSVHPGLSSGALSAVFWEMEDVDATAELTAEVREMRDRRREQERTFSDGIAEFRQQSLIGLGDIIEKYEAARRGLAGPTADTEYDRLTVAHGWLDRFEMARAVLDTDLDRSRRLHDELDPDMLSREFREPARRFADDLSSELLEASQRHAARRLCQKIEDLCDRHQLDEARSALANLVAMAVRGVDAVADAARGRVETLEREIAERTTMEIEFGKFRRRLRDRQILDARVLLETLERYWRTERTWLNVALAIEERAELRLRRGVLNLRLGAFEDALSDCTHLEPSAKGLLLEAQARFASGRGTTLAVEKALILVERSLTLGPEGDRPLAYYLRGVYRHQLLNPEDSGDPRLGEARDDLLNAVDRGFDSADAFYHLSAIYAFTDVARAIEFATRSLRAPLTEAGIVAAFGGLRQAVATNAIAGFDRDAHYVLANAHLKGEEYATCIDSCTRAIELDGAFARGFWLRGSAKAMTGRTDAALVDLREVIRILDEDASPADAVLRSAARELIKTLTGESETWE